MKKKVDELEQKLKDGGIRVTSDVREGHNPGYKYSYWEMRGIPLRLEVGQRDIEKSQVVLVRRDTNDKI